MVFSEGAVGHLYKVLQLINEMSNKQKLFKRLKISEYIFLFLEFTVDI